MRYSNRMGWKVHWITGNHPEMYRFRNSKSRQDPSGSLCINAGCRKTAGRKTARRRSRCLDRSCRARSSICLVVAIAGTAAPSYTAAPMLGPAAAEAAAYLAGTLPRDEAARSVNDASRTAPASTAADAAMATAADEAAAPTLMFPRGAAVTVGAPEVPFLEACPAEGPLWKAGAAPVGVAPQ